MSPNISINESFSNILINMSLQARSVTKEIAQVSLSKRIQMFWEVQNYASFPLTIFPVAVDDTIILYRKKRFMSESDLLYVQTVFLCKVLTEDGPIALSSQDVCQ